MATQEKRQKTLVASVIGLNAGLNTIKVKVERKLRHAKYGKLIKRHKNFLVDLTEERKAEIKLNQEVKIVQVKPISKNKSWKLV